MVPSTIAVCLSTLPPLVPIHSGCIIQTLLSKTLAFNAGGPGSICGWGAKILHVLQPKKKKNKPKNCKTEAVL